jgi:acetyl-CoA acetyltransferase
MTTVPRASRRLSPVHIVGLGATTFVEEHDAMQDELVFEAVRAALSDCGLRKQDAGIAVMASMDVMDGRSISSGLSTAASGGYLNDSYRVEGDSGVALAAAAEAVAAGDVEVAIAVGVHHPETRSADPGARRAFLEQVSNHGFDPHFDRPVGLTAEAVYAMHAAHALQHGWTTVEALADLAAAEMTEGAGRPRSVRPAATAADVIASTPVAWPLHDLMLPARSSGVVAIILASPARAGRSLGRSARLTGIGRATGAYTWGGRWLTDPGGPTRRATDMAYAQAGLQRAEGEIDVLELTAPTPALHQPYLEALGLGSGSAGTHPGVVNASGGARSNFPGLANGALRLLEVVEQLGERGSGRGLVHSVDTQTGLISEDVTVLVVEEV